MKRHAVLLGCVLVLVLAATAAHAQRATERYVPIGRSPGLSGKRTVIGTVGAVNAKARTLTCAHATGTATVKVTDRTRIWLDRSKDKLPSIAGTLADFIVGRPMEVRYVNDERKPGAEADWIKVQVAKAEGK
jgi:hypothetical protein